MNDLTSALLTVTDKARLLEVVRTSLPRLGIDWFVVCQYDRSNDGVTGPAMAEVLLSYGVDLAQASNWASAELLRSITTAAAGKPVVVCPLKVYQRSLGFVGFKMDGRLEPSLYEQVAQQLGAALYAMIMKDISDKSYDAIASLPQLAMSLVAPAAPELPSLRLVLQSCADRAFKALQADVVVLYEWNDGEFVLDDRGPVFAGKLRREDCMRSDVKPGDVVDEVIKVPADRFYGGDEFQKKYLSPQYRVTIAGRPPFAVREGIQAMSALVLKAGQETVGAMFVNYRTPRRFAEWEKNLHVAMASHAALVIRYARTLGSVARDTHRILGNVLNPIMVEFSEFLAHHQAIAQTADDPHRAAVDRLGKRVKWLLDAYQPESAREAEVNEIVHEFQSAGQGHNVTVEKEPYGDRVIVSVVLAHIRGVVRSLYRVALESHANRIRIFVSRSDVNWIHLRFAHDGQNQPRASEVFQFDPNGPLHVGEGRTLWWCRTALLSNGAWLTLEQAAPSVTFLLRLPVKRAEHD